ncbi:hypothetical protein DV738_g1024, partial [Chaetothyriales sp. CBS 135597]
MENLPAEILQQISWLSLNPELYLVSKKINSKLPPLAQFEFDLALILFCPRVGEETQPGWADVNPFPWQTGLAIQSDYKLTINERRELQATILSQSWFGAQKMVRLIVNLYKEWFDHHWISDSMSAKISKALEDIILQSSFPQNEQFFHDDHGNTLYFIDPGSCSIDITKRDTDTDGLLTVIQVLCYPLKLFVEPRSPDKLKLLGLFWSFSPDQWWRDHFYLLSRQGRSAFMNTLNSVVNDGDEEWFPLMYELVDFGQLFLTNIENLIWKLGYACKWNLMKQILERYVLEDDLVSLCDQVIRIPMEYCLATTSLEQQYDEFSEWWEEKKLDDMAKKENGYFA